MAYEIGGDAVITTKFRLRSTKVLTDPTAWQVRVLPPADNSAGALPEETVIFGAAAGAYATLSKVVDGHFEILITTSRAEPRHAGRWLLWVTSTGTAKASRSKFIVFDPPALTV